MVTKIRAVFTGQNGSMGYMTGYPYTLYVESDKNGITIKKTKKSWAVCLYTNMGTFLENWNQIQVVKCQKVK